MGLGGVRFRAPEPCGASEVKGSCEALDEGGGEGEGATVRRMQDSSPLQPCQDRPGAMGPRVILIINDRRTLENKVCSSAEQRELSHQTGDRQGAKGLKLAKYLKKIAA